MFHSDLISAPFQVKASDLTAKVRSEEIFKVLNAWDLSKL